MLQDSSCTKKTTDCRLLMLNREQSEKIIEPASSLQPSFLLSRRNNHRRQNQIMRLNNTIAAAILATAIIIATSTSFAAEVNIHADGTMSNPATKTSTTSWPDKILKGMDGDEAQREIKSVDPSLETHVLQEDAIVTEDYRLDRVRIFVDTDGKVVTQPQKG